MLEFRTLKEIKDYSFEIYDYFQSTIEEPEDSDQLLERFGGSCFVVESKEDLKQALSILRNEDGELRLDYVEVLKNFIVFGVVTNNAGGCSYIIKRNK